MTKIDAFKLEFYYCRVPNQPHKSRVYKTRVLKTKTESYKLDFCRTYLMNAVPKKTIWLEKKEEEQSDLGGRSDLQRLGGRRNEEQSKNVGALIGRDLVLVVFFFFFFFSMFSFSVFSFSPWICSSSCMSTQWYSSLRDSTSLNQKSGTRVFKTRFAIELEF